MQKKVVSFFILYFCLVEATAQINFNCIIKSSFTGKAVPGATVILHNGKKEIAKEDGTVQFSNITKGSYKVTISNTGFNEQHLTIDIPQTNPLLEIVLVPKEEKLEEVIVSSSRTNSRIEDLPTKVEVLGNEEVGEENGIKPGNIASLLGDVAGIQIQQTSAATANADARVQGLPGTRAPRLAGHSYRQEPILGHLQATTRIAAHGWAHG